MNWDPPDRLPVGTRNDETMNTGASATVSARRRSWRNVALVVGVSVAVPLLVVSAAGDSESEVHQALRRAVDALELDGDCVGLQAAFDRSSDADELSYIDDALRAAGCYD